MIHHPGLLTCLFICFVSGCYSQCRVSEDEAKRIITTCQDYETKEGLLQNRSDQSQALRQTVYLGSPFLTYPVWQEASLEVGTTNQSIPCKLAFNLVTNEIMCHFLGDAQEHLVLPEAFTINGVRFISQLNKNGGKKERVYYKVLYESKTKILVQFTCTLDQPIKKPYDLNADFDGTFKQKQTYFIKKKDAPPIPISLQGKSLRTALDDKSGKLSQYNLKKKLTETELIEAVAYYDTIR